MCIIYNLQASPNKVIRVHKKSTLNTFNTQQNLNNFLVVCQQSKSRRRNIGLVQASENGTNEQSDNDNANDNGAGANTVSLTQDQLNKTVTAAFEEGYQQGYTEGVQVEVKVDVDHPWLKSANKSEDSADKNGNQSDNKSSDNEKRNARTNEEDNDSGKSNIDLGEILSQREDSSVRSLIKSVTYLGFSSITLLVLYYFLGLQQDVGVILSYGPLQIGLGILIFYFHERLWNSIDLS
eukprot:TRINITY_DN1618_c0_g1_i7.p1 TRINITY_DN1618_c0_g1~~TRINITY_DN1618_c0_g1_i7.p1  ORF type:complete len:275 (+),score=20.73 TRINITY_DN1618_c0_g1_i7:116-826(+)